MLASMTAFARVQSHIDAGQICWEIRSVNHRFLDIHMRLPDVFRAMEMDWRNTIRAVLKRGKVECSLNFVPERAASTLRLNHEIVAQLAACAEALKQYGAIHASLNAIDVLKWPEVVAQDPFDMRPLAESITLALEQTLHSLQINRSREGAALKAILLERLDEIERLHERACVIAPLRLDFVKEKLKNKLSELSNEMSERLEQELVLYAQKLDVDEELDRLKTHIIETRAHLVGSECSGKHLDFLMQEFNREANTLASKSSHAELTQIALTLKVQIEKMREQIQNVE